MLGRCDTATSSHGGAGRPRRPMRCGTPTCATAPRCASTEVGAAAHPRAPRRLQPSHHRAPGHHQRAGERDAHAPGQGAALAPRARGAVPRQRRHLLGHRARDGVRACRHRTRAREALRPPGARQDGALLAHAAGAVPRPLRGPRLAARRAGAAARVAQRPLPRHAARRARRAHAHRGLRRWRAASARRRIHAARSTHRAGAASRARRRHRVHRGHRLRAGPGLSRGPQRHRRALLARPEHAAVGRARRPAPRPPPVDPKANGKAKRAPRPAGTKGVDSVPFDPAEAVLDRFVGRAPRHAAEKGAAQ
jgi:hypothetical protein